ncbi:hypothetical protein [Paenibacillus sp. 1001270B_150601_E10]|uniref:hypothetical protein n=1 Tax=Paenibacillus sp. 1001270B_150601_E10 TaxID=2787079 RepID=UPI001E31C8E1|nr:hypothetical protein [Paenibacillus sp. 1001270B_150601_E10]
MRKRVSVMMKTLKDEEVESSQEESQVELDIRDILEHLEIPLENVPDELRHLFHNGQQDK